MPEAQSEPNKKKGWRGWTIVGWSVFLVLFSSVVVFGQRIWYFYDQIQKGELIELPQTAFGLTAASGAPPVSAVVADREAVEAGDQPVLGLKDDVAELTIVMFGDFVCPYSQEAATTARSVMTRHAGQVRFIYRDYPITEIHPQAVGVSLAAECAREQGRFWAYHDKLYANQKAQAHDDLLRYGQELNLDMRQFEICLADERYLGNVEADIAAAKQLGLAGTPAFFFNGQRIDGAIPPDIFELIITRLVQ